MWAKLFVLATITSDGWYKGNLKEAKFQHFAYFEGMLEIVKHDKCPKRELALSYY